MNNMPFSRSALIVLLATGLSLFALSILLSAYDYGPTSESGGAGYGSSLGSYSTSAIGHAGFYDLLRRLDRPVIRSIGTTLALVGQRGTLIISEPEMRYFDNEDSLRATHSPRLLLVLPKWKGLKDDNRPKWIKSAGLVPQAYADQALAIASGGDRTYRISTTPEWEYNELGIEPSIQNVTQLFKSTHLRPIVGIKDGILLGELIDGDKIIWVLSDPDIISNHGLKNGNNAAFALALIDKLHSYNTRAGHDGPIVFDETVHGYKTVASSPLKMLFKFPLVIFTLLLCATGALLLFAGVIRFGPPRTVKPPLDFGKKQLIANSARLLDYAGHHHSILHRYIKNTVYNVAKTLHAPQWQSDTALAEWLDRIGEARGIATSCSSILERADSLNNHDKKTVPALFEIAWETYRWKGEILNGTAKNRRHS